MARNAIINAAEVASYDQVKQTILKIPGFTDNVSTHLLAGLGAGFFAVCIGSPVDVVCRYLSYLFRLNFTGFWVMGCMFCLLMLLSYLVQKFLLLN